MPQEGTTGGRALSGIVFKSAVPTSCEMCVAENLASTMFSACSLKQMKHAEIVSTSVVFTMVQLAKDSEGRAIVLMARDAILRLQSETKSMPKESGVHDVLSDILETIREILEV